MTITHSLENDPSKLEATQESLKALHDYMQKIGGCVDLGVVKICYDIQGSTVIVTVYVLGFKIATMTLDPNNPCQTVKVDVGIASGSLTLCFKNNCLTLSGKVCIVFAGCTSFNDQTIICV